MVFGRILGRLKSGPNTEPSVPEDVRLYAVGDIHGRDDLLERLLIDIVADGRHFPDKQKILVFLGDYVDRGLQSKQVIERLSTLELDGFGVVFLKGNHELAMLQFLGDAQFGRTWKYYGGLETLHSYGINELTLSDDPADLSARASGSLLTCRRHTGVFLRHYLCRLSTETISSLMPVSVPVCLWRDRLRLISCGSEMNFCKPAFRSARLWYTDIPSRKPRFSDRTGLALIRGLI